MCTRLNNARKWACDRPTEDADFGKKKKSSFQIKLILKLILILAGMQTSKIVAFGAQKTLTHILKSRRTQNESLFGTDFDLDWFGDFSSQMSKERLLQLMAMLNEFLFTKIEDKVIGNIWFQQDDDTCRLHYVETTLDVFKIALSAAELVSFGHLGAAI